MALHPISVHGLSVSGVSRQLSFYEISIKDPRPTPQKLKSQNLKFSTQILKIIFMAMVIRGYGLIRHEGASFRMNLLLPPSRLGL